jgi:pimeloyl-ACP methyl ester carboxylesterase
VRANGVELCVDEFGRPGDRAMLLIAGAGSSMDAWRPELCERLAAGRRRVVRYDHRDTGESVTYPPGEPGYSGADLVGDAVGILDALGIERADLMGISMGAGIAQVVALEHPDRVASLTLVSASFADRPLPDIPYPDGVEPLSFDQPEPDWSDRDAVVDYLVAYERSLASPGRGFDEPSARRVVAAAVDRSADIAAIANHDVLDAGSTPARRLEDLELPALVIHGAEDPMFPVGHGEALAAAIPVARLLVLEDVGHELPPESWDRVVPAVLELGSAGR